MAGARCVHASQAQGFLSDRTLRGGADYWRKAETKTAATAPKKGQEGLGRQNQLSVGVVEFVASEVLQKNYAHMARGG